MDWWQRKHRPDKRKVPIGPICIRFEYKQDQDGIFLLSRRCLLVNSLRQMNKRPAPMWQNEFCLVKEWGGRPKADPKLIWGPIWLPFGDPLGDHLGPLGGPLWGPLGGPLGGPIGVPLGDPFGDPLGDPLGTPWGPLGGSLGDPLGPLGDSLGPLGDPLGTPWDPFPLYCIVCRTVSLYCVSVR